MKQTLRRTYIQIVILGLLVCGLVAGAFFLIKIIHTRVDRVAEVKERIATYEANKSSFEKEAAQLASLQSRIKTVQSFVVTTETLPSLLSELEQQARAKGLVFEITNAQTPTENGVQKLDISFTARGAYEQLSSFLEHLLHQSYAATYTQIDIARDDTEMTPPAAAAQTQQPTTQSASKSSGTLFRVTATLRILSF